MVWGILSHARERRDEYYALFVFLVLWRALLPFVLRVVAGACVGRGSGQPRMPPRERQHEGLGGIGGFFCGWTEGGCEGEGLTTGVVRHACRLRRDGTRRFLVWGILLRLDWEPLRGHVLAAGEPVKESPAGKTSLSKISSSFRTSFRDSGMKISGISAARRRIPPELRLRCREATAREGHCGGAVGFVLGVVTGGEVESCEG